MRSTPSSRTRPRPSRGSRSTKPSSTSAGWSGSPAHPGRSPSAFAAPRARRLGLPLTVGIARTKHLAKIASAVAKPDGLLLVPPGDELAFLHPLPVERIWGIGPATAVRLHRIGVATAGELARVPEAELAKILGNAAARHLHALANNHDPRPVRRRRRRRSIGSQHAFGLRRASPAEIETDLARDRRPGHPAAPGGETRRPHGRSPPPLRRLQPGDPLPHASPPDRADPPHPRCRPLPARDRATADRAPGPDADRHHDRQPRERPPAPALPSLRRRQRRAPRRRARRDPHPLRPDRDHPRHPPRAQTCPGHAAPPRLRPRARAAEAAVRWWQGGGHIDLLAAAPKVSEALVCVTTRRAWPGSLGRSLLVARRRGRVGAGRRRRVRRVPALLARSGSRHPDRRIGVVARPDRRPEALRYA